MKNRRNYYRILQVQPDAPLEIIRASYRTLMRELMKHPDVGGDHWNASIINEAYETLSDSVRRTEYDRKYLKRYANEDTDKINCRNKKSKETHTSCESHKRATNRVKMNGTPVYYITSSKKRREAKMLDLSPEGIRFMCDEKLTHASTISMECSLFKAEAEIMNYNNLSNDTSNYSFGARFRIVTFRHQSGSFYSHLV